MPPKEKTTRKTSKSPSKSTPKTKKSTTKPTPKDGNKFYNVEKILARKKDAEHEYLYKVKWEGYTEADATWEPVENLKAVPELLKSFQESLVDKDSDDESDNENQHEEETDKKAGSKKTKTPKEKEPKEKKARKNPAAEKGIKPKKKLKTEKDTATPVQTSSNLKPKYGHFQFNDTPEAILKGRKEEDCLIFLVTWKPRKDGKVPKPTEMTSLELRKYDRDLLLDFYESKLTFKHVKPQREEGRSSDVEKTSENKKKQAESIEEEEEKVSQGNGRIETENNEEFENLQPADEVIEQEHEENVEEISENKNDGEKEGENVIDVEDPEGENPAEGKAQTNEQDIVPTLLIGESEGSDKNAQEEPEEIESPKEISDSQSNNENNQENQNANQDNVDELDFLASE